MTELISAETTIRDLENARQVLNTAGWFQGSLMDVTTGRVCLDGAISLATNLKLDSMRPTTVRRRARFVINFVFPSSTRGVRYIAAMRAVGDLLPDVCIEHGEQYPQPALRVWHFNDIHCDGAGTADAVLEQAIEKLKAELPS